MIYEYDIMTCQFNDNLLTKSLVHQSLKQWRNKWIHLLRSKPGSKTLRSKRLFEVLTQALTPGSPGYQPQATKLKF